MGASDSISTGRSTFLIETHEAADIMNKATSRSLVIMDELGRCVLFCSAVVPDQFFGTGDRACNLRISLVRCRGTSTHDGTAIAYATLKHLVSGIRCLTLFVTHYQPLCQMQNELPGKVSIVFMGIFN